MSRQVNIAEAKAKLSELVEAASRGEEIILARHGKPVAMIAPLAPAAKPGRRKFGKYAHLYKDMDWDKWWTEWKEADRELEEVVERSELFPREMAEDEKPFKGNPGKRRRRARRE